MNINYKLPLDFEHFFKNGKFEQCDEKTSIDQHIELLMTTSPGEHHFDPNYGCKIWDMNFITSYTEKQWQALFIESVLSSITAYEKRIESVVVNVDIFDVKMNNGASYMSNIRKQANIYVTGKIISTDELLRLKYTIYLGPISNE